MLRIGALCTGFLFATWFAFGCSGKRDGTSDSPTLIAGANAAGMAGIGVPNTAGVAPETTAAGAGAHASGNTTTSPNGVGNRVEGGTGGAGSGGGTLGGGGMIAANGGNSGDGAPDLMPSTPPQCATDANVPACGSCTHQGLVEGKVDGDTCVYLGIPYAKPPVGPRRFMPPEPAESWSGVRRATSWGTACVQGMDLSGSSQLGEDCLFINVWTPMTPPAQPLPVMVFLHGGGYSGGATNTYSGIGLSKRGPVVVVNMNYRVGALGFFAHPELDKQRPDKPSGSDGIRDQQLALRWVHDNISSFHGDPNNVTLFGESAGSSSVGIHLVSPGSAGLAQRFILESGVATRGVENGIAPVTRETMYAYTAKLTDELCPSASDVMECLRDLPPEKLMTWSPAAGGDNGARLGWVPVIEGPGGVLPDSPDALMERGEFHPGSIIVGTNRNEYGLFALLQGSVSSVEQMRARVQMRYPNHVDQIMALYAPSDSTDASQAYITLMTDLMFRCASRNFARLASAHERSVYLYSFEEGTAVHSDEMTYVFGYGNFTLGILPPVEALVESIQGYWLSFATTNDPNGARRPAWPTYETASDRHLTLVNPPSAGTGLQKMACDFWDEYLNSMH